MTGDPTKQVAAPTTDLETLILFPVEPQPDYIESSGRWHWPLPPQACFPGCCTSVVTASREWWEYAPSEAKPHPYAEGVRLRDNRWYWAVPSNLGGEGSFALRFATMWNDLLDSPSKHLLRYTNAQRFMYEADKEIADLKRKVEELENPSAHAAAGVTGHD